MDTSSLSFIENNGQSGTSVHELHNRGIHSNLSLVMIRHTAGDIRVQFRPSGLGRQGKKMVMYEK